MDRALRRCGRWDGRPPAFRTGTSAVRFKASADRRHQVTKQKRRVTIWPAYDASLQQRGRLTLWFTEAPIAAWRAAPRARRGGQPRYSPLATQMALTLRMEGARYRVRHRRPCAEPHGGVWTPEFPPHRMTPKPAGRSAVPSVIHATTRQARYGPGSLPAPCRHAAATKARSDRQSPTQPGNR